MKPVYLVIRKRHEVPTINQRTHKTKIIWKPVYKIDYSQNSEIFSCMGGTIQNDAQFSYWLKTAFGNGEYHINAVQKGYEGIWSFFRVVCDDTGYMRLRRKDKKMRKELLGYKAELNQLREEQNAIEDMSGKIEIQKEIDNYELAIKSCEDEEKVNTSGKRYGTYGFLKAVQPLYKSHLYQDHRRLPE